MGLILDRNEWNTRLSAENTTLSSTADRLMTVRDSFAKYANSIELKGASYDAARAYYQQVMMPFCQAAVDACTAKMDANNEFLEKMNSAFSDIGEVVLKQDELQEKINSFHAQITAAENLIAAYQTSNAAYAGYASSPGPDVSIWETSIATYTQEINQLTEIIGRLMAFDENTAGCFNEAETKAALVKAYADALQGITYTYTKSYTPQDVLGFGTTWGSGYYPGIAGLVNALDAQIGKSVKEEQKEDVLDLMKAYRSGKKEETGKGTGTSGQRGVPAVEPKGPVESEETKEPPLTGEAEEGKKPSSATVRKATPEDIAESKAKAQERREAARTGAKKDAASESTDAKPSNAESSSGGGYSYGGYSSGGGYPSGYGYSSAVGTAPLEEAQASAQQAASVTGGAAVIGGAETVQASGADGTESPQATVYTDAEAGKILETTLAEIPLESRAVISRQVMNAPEEYRTLLLDVMKDDFKITVTDGTPTVTKDGFSISAKELADLRTSSDSVFYDRLGKVIALRNGRQIETWNLSNHLSGAMKEEFARYCSANRIDLALTEKGYIYTGTDPSGSVQASVQTLQNTLAKEPVFVREAVYAYDPCLRNMTAETIAKGTAGTWVPCTDAERAENFLAQVLSSDLTGTGGNEAFAKSTGLARELTKELLAIGRTTSGHFR